jgi:hypothetical protein
MDRLHSPGKYTSGDAAILNFVSTQSGPSTRKDPEDFDHDYDPSLGVPLAADVVDAMINPGGAGHAEWAIGCIVDAPCRVGSHAPGSDDLPYIRTFIKQGCQPRYFMDGPCDFNQPFAFFLDLLDGQYWQGITDVP